jgi:hypothetical protein
MSVHPPLVRQFIPPSEEEAAERRAELDRQRGEREAAREAARPARRAAILTGPALRDVEAAVDCMCSCHPRPGDVDLHEAGQSCRCQLTETERAARMSAWLDSLDELPVDPDEERAEREREERFAAEAAALGVEARIKASFAPFVIVGVCDGRGFYLRERHGCYRVTIAPDDDPGSDPWAAESTEPSIDVASGDVSELDDHGQYAPAKALRVAVQAVRSALARNTCNHRRVESEPFCPSCGVRIDDADAWRWSGAIGDET